MSKMRINFWAAVIVALAALGAHGAEPGAAPLLRVGIVSDIHVQHPCDEAGKGGGASTATFEKALKYFREKGVDAVVVAGDLTEYGRVRELEASGVAWNRVFPGDKGLDGKPVAKLFIRGNHDKMGGLPAWAKPKDAPENEPLIRDDPAAAFAKALGITDYAPIMVREVKGYTFVLVNWESENAAATWLAEHAAELPADKPFFYVQHAHPSGTNLSSHTPRVTEELRKHPNAVAFSGHSHFSISLGSQIWQEEFTAVGTGCLQYMWNSAGRDNCWSMGKGQVGHAPRASAMGRQGLLMEVYGDRIVLERREFLTDKDVGPDWVVPLDGTKPYAWENQKARTTPPVFAEDAVVAAARKKAKNRNGEEEMQVQLTFPRPLPAVGDSGRTVEYEAVAFRPEDGEEKPLLARRAFAEKYFLADEFLAPTGLVCFAESEFPEGAKVRFAVRAMDCWERKGPPIYGEIVANPGDAENPRQQTSAE